MQNVKVSTHGNGQLMARQLPGTQGIWGDFQFFINKDNTSEKSEYDWWVIYDGLGTEETTTCSAGRTVFITAEPSSIKKYNKKFLAQFDVIITSQSGIKGKNVIYSHTALPWTLYTQKPDGSIDMSTSKTYDDLKKIEPDTKTKLLSIVSSNKNYTKGHRDRLAFVRALREHFGDRIDVFGPGQGVRVDGISPIKFSYHENKWEALAPYKYHIAVENSRWPHYWSEKITDAFLGNTHPLYCGAPDITDYFPAESLTQIDIQHPKEAIALIEKTIASNAFEKSKDARAKAKNLILESYQLFPFLEKILKERPESDKKRPITLRPESYFKNQSMKQRIINKIKRGIRSFSKKLILVIAKRTGTNLLILAYNSLGILNFKNAHVSGEDFFIHKILPQYLKTSKPVFFDVGAHTGNYSAMLREQFPTARIVSFEPNETPFGILKNHATDNKLEIHQVGLSSESATVSMYSDKNDTKTELASLYSDVITDLHRTKSTTHSTITVTRLDDFCTKNKIDFIDFLKIDTEGHELEVLRGAKQMLTQGKIGVIQFEFNSMNIVSRVFLRDFYSILSDFDLYRLNTNELIDLRTYSTENEIFHFQNIVALPKNQKRS